MNCCNRVNDGAKRKSYRNNTNNELDFFLKYITPMKRVKNEWLK